MLAIEAHVTVVDFECTGSVEGYPNQPWQIGVCRLRNGRIDEGARFASLLYVGKRPFNPYAPGRHAVLREELAAAPRLVDLWPVLSPWLQGVPLAAHQAAVERSFLGEAFPLHQFGPWIDTLELARIAYPRCGSHRLEDILKDLGLDERVRALCAGLGPHDALYDATACAALLEHLLGLPHWADVTVDDLAAARSGLSRSWRRRGPA